MLRRRAIGLFLLPALKLPFFSTSRTPCCFRLPLPAHSGLDFVVPAIPTSLNDDGSLWLRSSRHPFPLSTVSPPLPLQIAVRPSVLLFLLHLVQVLRKGEEV